MIDAARDVIADRPAVPNDCDVNRVFATPELESRVTKRYQIDICQLETTQW